MSCSWSIKYSIPSDLLSRQVLNVTTKQVNIYSYVLILWVAQQHSATAQNTTMIYLDRRILTVLRDGVPWGLVEIYQTFRESQVHLPPKRALHTVRSSASSFSSHFLKVIHGLLTSSSLSFL